jgi:serine/threonine protein kinase
MAGFVHCDIKPDNILVSANPLIDDKIYLVDYGLAH